jgi:hypothetical protein
MNQAGGTNQENIRHKGCLYQTRKNASKNAYENLTLQHFNKFFQF